MPIIGCSETIQGMSRDFLVDYKRTNYRGGDIIIAAAGAIEHHELMEMVEPYFVFLQSGSSRGLTTPPVYSRKCTKTVRNLEQMLFSLGTKGLPQNHPGRYDLLVLNTILGGSMSSKLFQEVREKAGLAYSIYSFLSSHSDTGAFVITGGTTEDKFPEVMKIITKELRLLKKEPLPDEILSNAREQLKGNILLSLESSDNIMSKLAKNEIYLGGYQSIEQVIAGLAAVTSETVLDLCNELFDDSHITLQLLGSMSETSFDLSDFSI
jgi:predicted Zn-dependent peptidase